MDFATHEWVTEEYDTSSRGHRHNPPARPLGEGVYRILRHINPGGRKRSMHTHLIYKLEFPSQDDHHEPQQALNIQREASFIIQIKNPRQRQVQDTNTSASDDSRGRRQGAVGLQNKRKGIFPAHLQGLFGRLRYAPADPPDFLNYEGCEFLLISASDDTQEELGLDLHTDEFCSDLVHTFGDMAVSTDVLFKGTWVWYPYMYYAVCAPSVVCRLPTCSCVCLWALWVCHKTHNWSIIYVYILYFVFHNYYK